MGALGRYGGVRRLPPTGCSLAYETEPSGKAPSAPGWHERGRPGFDRSPRAPDFSWLWVHNRLGAPTKRRLGEEDPWPHTTPQASPPARTPALASRRASRGLLPSSSCRTRAGGERAPPPPPRGRPPLPPPAPGGRT